MLPHAPGKKAGSVLAAQLSIALKLHGAARAHVRGSLHQKAPRARTLLAGEDAAFRTPGAAASSDGAEALSALPLPDRRQSKSERVRRDTRWNRVCM